MQIVDGSDGVSSISQFISTNQNRMPLIKSRLLSAVAYRIREFPSSVLGQQISTIVTRTVVAVSSGQTVRLATASSVPYYGRVTVQTIGPRRSGAVQLRFDVKE
jgi:hypothetical protein